MQEIENPTLEQMRAFLTENAEIRFEGEGRKEIYAWADQLLKQQTTRSWPKQGKGLVRR